MQVHALDQQAIDALVMTIRGAAAVISLLLVVVGFFAAHWFGGVNRKLDLLTNGQVDLKEGRARTDTELVALRRRVGQVESDVGQLWGQQLTPKPIFKVPSEEGG